MSSIISLKDPLRIMMRRFIITAFIVFCSVAIIKHKKIYRYFEEQRYYESMVKLHIFKDCYSPHKDIVAIFNQEGFNYFEKDQEITKNSLAKLEDNSIRTLAVTKIPLITQKAYFVLERSSQELTLFYLEELKKIYNDFGADI